MQPMCADREWCSRPITGGAVHMLRGPQRALNMTPVLLNDASIERNTGVAAPAQQVRDVAAHKRWPRSSHLQSASSPPARPRNLRGPAVLSTACHTCCAPQRSCMCLLSTSGSGTLVASRACAVCRISLACVCVTLIRPRKSIWCAQPTKKTDQVVKRPRTDRPPRSSRARRVTRDVPRAALTHPPKTGVETVRRGAHRLLTRV